MLMRRPGCYNQPRPTDKSGYYVKARKYWPDGHYHLEDEWIPFAMSKECHHDGLYSDCDGCTHRRQE